MSARHRKRPVCIRTSESEPLAGHAHARAQDRQDGPARLTTAVVPARVAAPLEAPVERRAPAKPSRARALPAPGRPPARASLPPAEFPLESATHFRAWPPIAQAASICSSLSRDRWRRIRPARPLGARAGCQAGRLGAKQWGLGPGRISKNRQKNNGTLVSAINCACGRLEASGPQHLPEASWPRVGAWAWASGLRQLGLAASNRMGERTKANQPKLILKSRKANAHKPPSDPRRRRLARDITTSYFALAS